MRARNAAHSSSGVGSVASADLRRSTSASQAAFTSSRSERYISLRALQRRISSEIVRRFTKAPIEHSGLDEDRSFLARRADVGRDRT